MLGQGYDGRGPEGTQAVQGKLKTGRRELSIVKTKGLANEKADAPTTAIVLDTEIGLQTC
jgi:hypothetical protein